MKPTWSIWLRVAVCVDAIRLTLVMQLPSQEKRRQTEISSSDSLYLHNGYGVIERWSERIMNGVEQYCEFYSVIE